MSFTRYLRTVLKDPKGIQTKDDDAMPLDGTGLSLALGSATFAGKARNLTSTALTATGTASLDPTLGEVFTVTPTGALTINATSADIGTRVVVRVLTSGVSSFTITFGTNFKSTGTLATGTSDAKEFTVSFIGDGTNLVEVARTAAM